MNKKIESKLVLLILVLMILYLSSTIPRTVAQESITITGHGCTSCNTESNSYSVYWSYTGTIPQVSILIYDLTNTTLEYTVVDGTTNLGSYSWSFPVSHPLDGEYNLVVCDYSNHNVNDSVQREIYPIQTYSPQIPGYPMLSIGLIIGITSIIVTIHLTKKLRKG
ncbi:MAG: hypothetical protein ACFE9Z_09595 [Promethearchaeota archaeon]